MRLIGQSERFDLALIIGTMGAIFVFDTSTSLGIAAAVLYTLPILMSYWATSPRTTWLVAVATTALTLAGMVASPTGGETYQVQANRALALAMIWVTASLVARVKRADSLRRSAERQSRMTVDASMDAIIVMDARGSISDWNPQARATFGWTREEAIGRNLADLVIPEEYRRAHVAGFERLLATGESRILGDRVELEALRRDGSRFPVELTVTHCAGGGEVLFSGSLRDISERLAAERTVERYAADLRRSNEDLDSFAYAASHDLKAPLRAIDSLATWIAEDSAETMSPESREDLAMLRSRIDRMQRLLDDLLAYSRIGRTTAAFEVIDLAELVEDTMLLLDLPQGFKVRVGPVPTFVARRTLFEHVVVNLIGNAVKHRASDDGCVVVDASIEGDWIHFSVKDDGTGIAPEYHERIFELFQTLAPRDRVEGSGMGLAMVKKIVEREGGTIGVDSAAGEGATFRFTWPVGQLEEEKRDD